VTALGPATVKQPASDAGSWLIVAECFGVETPTFQGEGPSCGHPALFIRLSRCNLTCARCDTKYTRDWSRFDPRKESTKRSVADLVAWAASSPVELVVITDTVAAAARAADIRWLAEEM
jgi:uncharacterized Zn-finger protein